MIYVNDIVNAADDIEIHLFADGAALFIQGKYIHIIFNTMKNCMVKLTEWFSCNRPTLNLTKTCYNIFHVPKISKMYDKMTTFGSVIQRENKLQYLGLMTDEKLSWKDHINYLLHHYPRFFGIFNKINHFVSKQHISWQFIMLMYFLNILWCANSQIRFDLKIVFVYLYLTPSHYHHCASFSEDIELIKCLSDIVCRVCE